MYLNSFCSLSPAGILRPGTFIHELRQPEAPRASCAEPDYKELIPPMQLRRMTMPVRTGVAAAKLCLSRIEAPLPDAIHAGTAYGMLQDSEQFLKKMIGQEEQMLNPTAFIQSTHNTVAGQIALALGCNAHNMTFVHKGHSFESAMLDAALRLEDHPEQQVLAGAVDECTDTSYALLRRFGVYTDNDVAGEGATFFCLSGQQRAQSLLHIRAFEPFIADDAGALSAAVRSFINRQKVSLQPGDPVLSAVAHPEAWAHNPVTLYKEYCGSFPTDVAFGLALAAAMLQQEKKERCWLLAGFGRHYSLWLLERI